MIVGVDLIGNVACSDMSDGTHEMEARRGPSKL